MSRIVDMFQGDPQYVVNDPDSDFVLEKGKRYFMDFDISNPEVFSNVLATHFDVFKIEFLNRMYERGHIVQDTVVHMPDAYTLRFTFTSNPIPLVIAIAIGVAVIFAATGLGAGFFVMFKGLGEALPAIPDIPVKILEGAVKNPIAVVAIVIAVGLFILGVKL